MEQNVPLVRRFSELEPYQEAYTLVCSLEPTGVGCWLSVSRTMARDGSADAAVHGSRPHRKNVRGCCDFYTRIPSSRSCGGMPFPTGIHRQRRQKSCGKGARRVSFEEQQEAVWRVALASYDPREMRVWMPLS